MKTVYVDVEVRLKICVNDDQDISEVLEEMNAEFTDQTGGANIEDTEIEDWDIIDSE